MILLNNPGVQLTEDEKKIVNTTYEQYFFFTLKGLGNDDSTIKDLKFKQASQAIDAFNIHLKTGSVVGKHSSGSNNILIRK